MPSEAKEYIECPAGNEDKNNFVIGALAFNKPKTLDKNQNINISKKNVKRGFKLENGSITIKAYPGGKLNMKEQDELNK